MNWFLFSQLTNKLTPFRQMNLDTFIKADTIYNSNADWATVQERLFVECGICVDEYLEADLFDVVAS